jgi:FMN phosphatase YigB (HAD superfamily)
MNTRPKTIFCDIDGTLIKHDLPINITKEDYKLELIEGTLEKLQEWDTKGYNIILTTGRKESLRRITEKHLQDAGIVYDQLIMGIGGGSRVLINDLKPSGEQTAFAFNVIRNKEGIKNIEI